LRNIQIYKEILGISWGKMKDDGEYYTMRERERERAKTVPSGFNLVSPCSILFIISKYFTVSLGTCQGQKIQFSFDKMAVRMYNYLKHVNKEIHVS
jgi:hypothetical protein